MVVGGGDKVEIDGVRVGVRGGRAVDDKAPVGYKEDCEVNVYDSYA